jgi:hypothetical protein
VRTGELWRHQNLVVLVILAALAAMAVAFNLHPVVRVPLSLPLVFIGPGYVLHAALSPRNPLTPLETLLVSVGGSIVIAILLGLLVAAFRVPLEPMSWTLALATFTMIGAAIAWFRKRNLEREPRGHGFPTMRAREAVLLTIAIIGSLGILVGTRVIASGQEEPPPEQLWLIPRQGALDARLGMRAGGQAGAYTIRLTSAGALLQEFTLQLSAGETWEQDLTFTEEERSRPVVGRLYAGETATELRFVVLQPPPNAT